jgi:hypothetical protein
MPPAPDATTPGTTGTAWTRTATGPRRVSSQRQLAAEVYGELVGVEDGERLGNDGKLGNDGISVGDESLPPESFSQWVEK